MALSSSSSAKDATRPIVDVAVLRNETAELKEALAKLTCRWAQVSEQVKDIRGLIQQDFSRLASGKTVDSSTRKSVRFSPEPRGCLKEFAYQPNGTSSSSSGSSKRHLVINLDVNKTILMSDKVQNKNVDHIVNEILSDAAWGTEVDGAWVLSVQEPNVQRPNQPADGKADGPDLVSYTEWLASTFPGSKNKKHRSSFTTTFTDAGHPGESMISYADNLRAGLRLADGQPVQIIRAFFELMVALKQEKRSFTLCFRTFGEDLLAVSEELNEFCEGKHVFSPAGVVFDGSDGEPDYRITPGDTQKCGTFYRDDTEVALIWGTWWQPEKEPNPSMAYYENMEGVVIDRGSMADAAALVRKKVRTPGSLALRDYFLYWKSKDMSSAGGKLLFYDRTGATGMHEIFFDDNIRFTDAHIVHPIDCKCPDKKQWVTPLLVTHLCRAEPLMSIADPQYFVKETARLEAGFTQKLEARGNLTRLMLHSRFITRLSHLRTTLSRVEIPPQDKSHDAWKKYRRSDLQLSIPLVEPEEVKVEDI